MLASLKLASDCGRSVAARLAGYLAAAALPPPSHPVLSPIPTSPSTVSLYHCTPVSLYPTPSPNNALQECEAQEREVNADKYRALRRDAERAAKAARAARDRKPDKCQAGGAEDEDVAGAGWDDSTVLPEFSLAGERRAAAAWACLGGGGSCRQRPSIGCRMHTWAHACLPLFPPWPTRCCALCASQASPSACPQTRWSS